MAEKKRASEGKLHWRWYLVTLTCTSLLIPVVCLYLRSQGWIGVDVTVIAVLFAGYWLGALAVATRLMRGRGGLQQIKQGSPLIELQLNSELRAKLAAFAAARQQQPAVAAFELLDREIPRFEPEEDRHRAQRDNEHLRQQSGSGAFPVAVTTELLKRLLLLSGAREEDRRLWRVYVGETAQRIVATALDHRMPAAE